MQRIVVALLIVITSTISAAAQSAPQPQTPKATPRTNTTSTAPAPSKPCVGVMSAVGDTLTLQKLGVMVFGNEEIKAPIGRWGIDDFIAGRISAALGDRWSMKRLAPSQAALHALETNTNPFSDSSGAARKIVQQAAAGSGCQRHITVWKTSSQIGNSNQRTFGLGMLESGIAMGKRFNLFAVLGVVVYDGQTFDKVLDKRVADEPFNLLSFKTVRGLSREIDASWWPAQPAQVATDTRLRNAMLAVIDKGLSFTIPDVRTDGKF